MVQPPWYRAEVRLGTRETTNAGIKNRDDLAARVTEELRANGDRKGVSGRGAGKWLEGGGIAQAKLPAVARALRQDPGEFAAKWVRLGLEPPSRAVMQDAERVPVDVGPGSVLVHVYAEASAGRGAAYRLREVVYVPAEDAGRRRLIAVKIVGQCMYPKMLPGDIVIFEKVPDDQIHNGDRVLITLLDQQEDGAYLVKYLQWGKRGTETVILTAEDDTRLEVPYDRVVIEGRYWRLQRD